MSERLARACDTQARLCRALDAPLYAELCARAAGAVRAGGNPVADVLAHHDGDPLRAAVILRLFGGVHRLVLDGLAPELAGHYPTAGGAARWPRAWTEFEDVVARHLTELRAALSVPPQTNEVGRAAALLGGFLTIADHVRLPLRTLELGASAGLLQLWPHFGYRLGDATWGPAGSPVQLRCSWAGPCPPRVAADVVARAGCDLAPIDPRDREQIGRLRGFVWADHQDRLRVLDGALALARSEPPAVDAAKADEWTEHHLALADGACTILFHAVVWTYLPPTAQRRIVAHLDALGARATPAAPLAWLRLEDPPAGPGTPRFELRLRQWPGGEDRLLARAHPHGRWVEWLG